MMRFLTLLLLLSSVNVSAQSIRGQILIYGTDKPLPNASIFYDGMYKGGISDENGNFQLALLASDKTPIIVSAVGYQSSSINNYTREGFLKVYLHPKVYNLETVVVTFDGLTREEKEAIFKKEFIGSSENAALCEILNMDDIDLTYDRKRSRLEAFSKEPILLHNKALGFKISYYLDRFISSNGDVYFAGNYFFEPDTALKGRELSRVERRRKDAYLGSRMHFIRSIYNNRLDNDEFDIINGLSERVDYTSLIIEGEKEKNIRITSPLTVIYKGDTDKPTFLDGKKDFTFIDKSGFYDPSGMTWSGKMAGERMGDLLPFEYGLKEK